MITTKAYLKFDTDSGSSKNILINDPITTINKAGCDAAAASIISTNIFTSTGGNLKTYVGAFKSVTTRTVLT